jgi:hypothetical protein
VASAGARSELKRQYGSGQLLLRRMPAPERNAIHEEKFDNEV